jgi:DNA-binding PadR family transcriptional regulator
MRHGVRRHNELPSNAEPLTEAVFLILLSLAEQPRHGYSIRKDVEEMSGGRVVLSTGTLYGALRRLLGDGWIERFEEEEASRDRHAYRLTLDGRRLLQVEVARMKHLARIASLRMSLKEA